MSDIIIRPAPAQSEMVLGEVKSVPSINIIHEDKKMEENNRKSNELCQTLRVIDNICGPYTEYLNFNKCLKPEIRVILDLHQTTMLFLGLKIAAKNVIDMQYMNIQNPSSQVKVAMEKTYDNLDSLTDNIRKSMEEMSLTMQSLILASKSEQVTTSQETILTDMKDISKSKLPC